MKKLVIIFIAILSLCSCTQFYYPEGHDFGFDSKDSTTEGEINTVGYYYFTGATTTGVSSSNIYSTYGSQGDVVDGDTSTYFEMQGESKVLGEYIYTVDIGYSYYMDEILFKVGSDNGSVYLYASTDSSTWVSINSWTTSTTATITLTATVQTSYRYFKIVMQSKATQSSNPKTQVFEVYTNSPPNQNSAIKIDSSSGSYYLAKEATTTGACRVYNGTEVISLALVDTDSSLASGVRLYDGTSIKSVAKYIS